MDKGVLEVNDEPQVDEKRWQAWMQKNKDKDAASFARIRKVLVIVALLGIALLLYSRFG